MAQILKALGGTDYTNLAVLFKDMRQYDGLSEYQRRSAYLAVLVQSAAASGVPDLTAEFQPAISAWYDATLASMKNAETFLFCQLVNSIT